MSLQSDMKKYGAYFVKVENATPLQKNMIMKTYKGMSKYGHKIRLITENQCLNIKRGDKRIFVMEPFSGPTFNHLKKMNLKVLGICFIVCTLNYDVPYPRRPWPVYSLAMYKLTVACHGISKEIQDEIREKVEYMGGLFRRKVNASVTHVIVGDSEACTSVSAVQIMMKPDWIRDLYENGQYQFKKGTDPLYDKYKVSVSN